MWQTSDEDKANEELTAEEYITETVVRTAAEAGALAQAEELDPADDIPAGAEAGHPKGSVPGSVSRGIAGVETEQHVVPGFISMTVEILQYTGLSDVSEMNQSSRPAESPSIPMEQRSIQAVGPIATVANAELLRQSLQQPFNMLTLPLEVTVRPASELKELAEFLQQFRPLPELPTTEEHFLPSDATYSELSKRVTGKIRTWTDKDVRAESKAQQANEAKTVARSFQKRLEDMLDAHSEAISAMDQLISFTAKMPEKVLFRLRHRHVAFDMISSDRHRWGRDAAMAPAVITMQFRVKTPTNREDSDAFFTLYAFFMPIMRSAVSDIADFKALSTGCQLMQFCLWYIK